MTRPTLLHRLFTPLCAAGLSVGLVACDQDNDTQVEGYDGEVRTVSTTPQGSTVTDGLQIERVMPEQLFAGSSNQYTLKVSNDGESALHNVVIHEATSTNLTLPDQQPSQAESADGPTMEGKNHYRHDIGRLAPGESREVQISAQLADGNQIEICTWATYDVVECATFEVANPDLVLMHDFVDADGNVISEAYRCDEVFVRYRLENRGTGEVPGVTVMEQLPDGLILAEGGQAEHSVDVGEVDAEGTVTSDLFALDLEDVESSQLTARAVANAERVGEVADSSTLRILSPALSMQVSGPSEQYIGREVQMQVSLTNDGDAPVKDVELQLPIPEDAERLSISRGDVQRGDDGEFEVGTLAAGETRNFNVSFLAEEPGEYESQAVATGYCVAEVRQPVSLAIVGIPALQLEVIDRQDPVRIGEQTVYEIRMFNEGSADDLDIRVTGELPDGFSFVSAEGDLPGEADGNRLSFPVIDKLGPGEELTMQVTVRADEANRGKLKLNVQSQELSQTLREEESTTSY
jgi:hypothetical protein